LGDTPTEHPTIEINNISVPEAFADGSQLIMNGNFMIEPYIRFSPGGNYIIPKKNILKYSKKFYERIRECMNEDVITAEIWMIERATYTIFICDWEVNEQYK